MKREQKCLIVVIRPTTMLKSFAMALDPHPLTGRRVGTSLAGMAVATLSASWHPRRP